MGSTRLAPSSEPPVISAADHPGVRSPPGPVRHKGRHHAWTGPSAALCAAFLLAMVHTEAHENAMDGNPSNDWIEGLKNSTGKSCCGNNDCRPVVAGGLVSSPRGGLLVEIDGRRFQVPEGSIVPETSPDGRAWVCPDLRAPPGGFTYSIQGVRCLLLPPLT